MTFGDNDGDGTAGGSLGSVVIEGLGSGAIDSFADLAATIGLVLDAEAPSGLSIEPVASTVIAGGEGNDSLIGNVGDDRLDGEAGDDTLIGGFGDDTLDGGVGDDALFEGAGDDALAGGLGSDRYAFGLGDGQDAIVNVNETGTTDLLAFGAGIDAQDLWFHQVGDDLQVSVVGTDDQVTIDDWYVGTAHQLDSFESSDGSTLAAGSVQQLVDAMAAFDPLVGQGAVLSQAAQDAVFPEIAAAWQEQQGG